MRPLNFEKPFAVDFKRIFRWGVFFFVLDRKKHRGLRIGCEMCARNLKSEASEFPECSWELKNNFAEGGKCASKDFVIDFEFI